MGSRAHPREIRHIKRLYLDTNVVLDVPLARPPFAVAAQDLLLAGQRGQAEMLVSSLAFTTAHYVLSKAIGKAAATQALTTLAARVTVVTINAAIISQALYANRPDFEDAVQLFAALAAGADLLVTRDPKGFAGGLLPVLDPVAALVAL